MKLIIIPFKRPIKNRYSYACMCLPIHSFQELPSLLNQKRHH